MGDAAVGAIVMSSYSNDLDNPQNKEFLKAWEAEYGKKFTPDFMSAQGWDTMAAVFDAIKKLKGDFSNGEKVVEVLKNYKGEGPRGPIAVDPVTRDIIQDEHAMEVIKKPDGTLGHKILGTIKQVKDQCKELKVGRCAS
jgi:branched-chain amino acid transport system substrate-binding protein